MKKNLFSKSGVYNSRAFVTVAVCSAGALLALLSFAANPSGGGGWSVVTSPNSGNETVANDLNGVTCVSGSDCWAVGNAHNPNSQAGVTLIEQWNGASWSIIPSPNSGNGTVSNDLHGVTCVSGSDCWAVGNSYDPNSQASITLIEHWDSASWSIVTSPDSGTAGSQLLAVTCTSTSNCWAVGYNVIDAGSGTLNTLIEQWNGSSWSIVASPNASTGMNALDILAGVTCASASNCWAVGRFETSSRTTSQALIEQYATATKADFNGDGKSDIVWQDTQTGQRAIWLMNGTTISRAVSLPTIPTQWQIRNH
jgi:hypothetical protein